MSTRQPTVTIPLAYFEQLMEAWYLQKGWTPPDGITHGVQTIEEDPKADRGVGAAPTIDLRSSVDAALAGFGHLNPSDYEPVPPEDLDPGPPNADEDKPAVESEA